MLIDPNDNVTTAVAVVTPAIAWMGAIDTGLKLFLTIISIVWIGIQITLKLRSIARKNP